MVARRGRCSVDIATFAHNRSSNTNHAFTAIMNFLIGLFYRVLTNNARVFFKHRRPDFTNYGLLYRVLTDHAHIIFSVRRSDNLVGLGQPFGAPKKKRPRLHQEGKHFHNADLF